MWRITPNRLTLLRIFLLPLPCLLLFGGPESKLTAVGVGSLLGLTDYLDGRLARSRGPSRLGALLDPVADKIFVGVTFLLLSHLRYIPYWAAGGLLLREILVSALRGVFPEKFAVWSLARFKTAFQMAGAGVIILAINFLPPAQADLLVRLSLVIVLGLTWASAVPYLRKGFALLQGPKVRPFLWRVGPALLLVGIFPWSGALWPGVLVLLSLVFLADILWRYGSLAKGGNS